MQKTVSIFFLLMVQSGTIHSGDYNPAKAIKLCIAREVSRVIVATRSEGVIAYSASINHVNGDEYTRFISCSFFTTEQRMMGQDTLVGPDPAYEQSVWIPKKLVPLYFSALAKKRLELLIDSQKDR